MDSSAKSERPDAAAQALGLRLSRRRRVKRVTLEASPGSALPSHGRRASEGRVCDRPAPRKDRHRAERLRVASCLAGHAGDGDSAAREAVQLPRDPGGSRASLRCRNGCWARPTSSGPWATGRQDTALLPSGGGQVGVCPLEWGWAGGDALLETALTQRPGEAGGPGPEGSRETWGLRAAKRGGRRAERGRKRGPPTACSCFPPDTRGDSSPRAE